MMMNAARITNWFGFLCIVFVNDVHSDKEIHIGGILSSISGEQFRRLVDNMRAPENYTFKGVSIVAVNNSVKTASDICDHLVPQKVVTALFEVSKEFEQYMTSVPFTLEYYKIPVIGLSSRSSVLSNTYAHPYFLRTLPANSFEAGLWFDLLRSKLKYNKVIFIYSNDVEGETTLNVFRNLILQTETAYGEKSFEYFDSPGVMQISKLIMLQPYDKNFTSDLKPILSEDARVVVLAVKSELAKDVYSAAEQLRIIGPSWVWLVGEEAASVDYVPQGVLSWRSSPSLMSPISHMTDALKVIEIGITKYINDGNDLGNVPRSCSLKVLKDPDELQIWEQPSIAWWPNGVELFESYLEVTISDGETGPLRFDSRGDRRSIGYDLINFGHNGSSFSVGNFSVQYDKNESEATHLFDVYEKKIIWPGDQREKPDGVNVSKHLRVVTIQETPFVQTEPFDMSVGCNASQRDDPDAIAKMYCPKHLPNGTLEFCCYGYLIDMLDMLKMNMSVTFDLHLVADDKYGDQVPSNTSGKTKWNGMMGELLEGKADMIVAPFVINPERAKYVEFTKPFKFLGITILVKKNPKKSNLGSFLQPFQKTLWFLVVVSVHVIALVLYLLDRFSPFGQLQLARETDSEDALSLSTAIWFAWGVLLNSGIGEGTPKSFSARVLGMVWAGFAMIIVASYTANLAAFLVLDKPEASISGIDDPRLRNPTDNFKFATVQDSAIEEYFKRQVEFTTMYRTMENQNKRTVEDAINSVKAEEDSDDKLDAFIWDSPRLIYEASNSCNLVTAGELFGRSSYGIAFRKNSHWTDRFSLQILSYHEESTMPGRELVGQMEKYDNKWIMNGTKTCETNASSPATLGLSNMAGVFIMVAVGIGIGFVILLIEIGYSKYETMKEKQNNIAKKAVARWKRYVQRRKALRKTWALIKDINETENFTDDEVRHRIRDYLEHTGGSSRTPSVVSLRQSITSPGDTAPYLSNLSNNHTSHNHSNGHPPSPLPILLQPTTAGSFRQTPNQMEHSINSRNDPDTSINQNTPTDCESNSTHPQNTSEHTNPLNVRATPNGDIEMQNIQNDALCKPVTPTISVTVPQIDLKTTSPYNQAEGEVKHNPVFMDN